MRVLQIIDSLEAGGAERMAVNYANALADVIDFSGLVVTRTEGALLNQVSEKVSYLYLNKKRTIDLKAVFALRKFAVKNKVAVVHAHSTSFFLAFLLKVSCPSLKLIWHDHYGARVHQSRTDNLILFFSSIFFSSIFVVNPQLENWVKKMLFTKKVFYIPNFATLDENQNRETVLKGNFGSNIVCLANLKDPKNHIALFNAFKELKLKDFGWSLHLIGRDYNDDYSDFLKNFIRSNDLERAVHIYNTKNDIHNILSQATIGVLCSTDEGFPVSILEYGLAKLAVVSTNVGYCSEIIQDEFNGLLFDPLNYRQLQEQLKKMVLDKVQREQFALNLHNIVLENYSKENIVQLLLSKYNLL